MKHTQYLFFLLIITVSTVFSQDKIQKTHFISVHSGSFISSIDQLSKTYQSQYSFANGLEIALASFKNGYFFVKVSYYSKKGSPLIRSYDYINGSWVISEKQGSAKFTQLLINEGFLYNLYSDQNWGIGINGGITFTLLSQEVRNSIGELLNTPTDPSGVYGVFTGLVFERKFNSSNFTVFLEPQYNYIQGSGIEINYPFNDYHGNYGGLNLSAGVRYYFTKKITNQGSE